MEEGQRPCLLSANASVEGDQGRGDVTGRGSVLICIWRIVHQAEPIAFRRSGLLMKVDLSTFRLLESLEAIFEKQHNSGQDTSNYCEYCAF